MTIMAAVGNSQQGDNSASASSEEHPLISLHANNKNSTSAAATAANNNKATVKRETTECDNKDNVRIMSSRNDHSSLGSSSSWKLSSLFSIKTAILLLILSGILVLVYMISSLEATHEVIMDNKIATSAILLHHCHSFMMAFANAVSKLVLSLKDAVLFITTTSLSSSSILSTNSHSNNEVMAIEQLQTRLQKGQLLLSAYNDQSGSDMVCHGVANSVVRMANERKWKRMNGDTGSSHG